MSTDFCIARVWLAGVYGGLQFSPTGPHLHYFEFVTGKVPDERYFHQLYHTDFDNNRLGTFSPGRPEHFVLILLVHLQYVSYLSGTKNHYFFLLRLNIAPHPSFGQMSLRAVRIVPHNEHCIKGNPLTSPCGHWGQYRPSERSPNPADKKHRWHCAHANRGPMLGGTGLGLRRGVLGTEDDTDEALLEVEV